jgi:uncharacterized membrane protein
VSSPSTVVEGGTDPLDLTIARILTVGSYLSVGFIAIGVVLMAVNGRSPLDPPPGFDPTALVREILEARPEGFLWLGLLILLATPATRVAASLVGYIRSRERQMTAVSIAILVVIAGGVIIGVVLGTPTAG